MGLMTTPKDRSDDTVSVDLVELIDQTYGSEDGIERLFDGLEVALEGSDESPRQVGIGTVAARELPVGAHVYTEVQLAQVVGEVVCAARRLFRAEVYACAGGVADTQMSVVGIA